MKKLFVSILALSAFVACQSDYNDVNLETPQGGNAQVVGSHTIYAEVGIGGETKATYDGDLKAMWEENDQIALLQEHADYGKSFTGVNMLPIKSGWGTNSAAFSGDITVDATAPRVYHIAYPASAVSFSTSMTQEIAGVDYGDNIGTAGYEYKATGYGICTYNSTMSITIPTSQGGKWEPYMYASTTESVSSNGIGAKTLNTLTGAIAIRAYENDKSTSKRLKSITLTSSKAIAGAFSGTATSVGNTATITGATSGWYTAFQQGDAKNKALENLTSALRSYEATETSPTKAMSLSFAGSETAITADVESIAADANGVYTYYINVAPFAESDLVAVVTAEDGSTLIRELGNYSLEAGHSKGFNIQWEEATLSVGGVETWYDDYSDSSFNMDGGVIYGRNIKVEGVPVEQVTEIGMRVYAADETVYEVRVQNALSSDEIRVTNLPSGSYTAHAYAKVTVNGIDKELIGSVISKTVTSIPTITNYYVKSSYSYNGNTSKNNSLDGSTLYVKADLSDAYVKSNCVSSRTFHYGNNTKSDFTLGSEKTYTLGASAWGQYGCYVKIVLKNGYEIKSNTYTTQITGIPYKIETNSATPTDWISSNTAKNGYLCLKEGKNAYVVSLPFRVPSSCNVVVTIPMYAYGGSIYGKYKPRVYASATASTSGSASGVSTTLSGSNLLPNAGAKYTNWTPTVSLSVSAPRISIYATGSGSGWSVGSGSMGVIIKSINVQYE